MIRKRIAGILVAGVTVAASLALMVGGAGIASAATTSVNSSHVAAAQAMSAAVAPNAEAVIGPVATFSTEEQCVLAGALEFPPGSYFEGYEILGTFCETGVAVPPTTGKGWDLFVLVDVPVCDSAASAPPVTRAAQKTAPAAVIC